MGSLADVAVIILYCVFTFPSWAFFNARAFEKLKSLVNQRELRRIA